LTFLIGVALDIFEDARHPNFMDGHVTCTGTKYPISLDGVFLFFLSKYKQNRRIKNGIFLTINPNKMKMLPNMRLVGAHLTKWPGAHDYLHFLKLFQHMKKFLLNVQVNWSKRPVCKNRGLVDRSQYHILLAKSKEYKFGFHYLKFT
jgi:hypothetical protein